MRLLDAYITLSKFPVPVLSTSDAAFLLKVPAVNASKILQRLSNAGQVQRLKRGKWLLAELVNPLIIPQYLTAPWPSYISLHTALFHHGLIEQIPTTTWAVTLDRTKLFKTKVGIISLHHIDSKLFLGFDYAPKATYQIATPEKALFDVFYFGAYNVSECSNLPEVELPKSFNWKVFREYVSKINSKRVKTMVVKRADRY